MNRRKSHKNVARQILALFGYALFAALLALYGYLTAYSMIEGDYAALLPGFGVTFMSLLVLMLNLFNVSGVMFAYGDYDMLMSFPIKTSTVILSKFLSLYLPSVFCSLSYMIPIGMKYCNYKGQSPASYIYWIVGGILVPLVPVTLAVVLGAIIIWITSKSIHKNILNSVLSLVIGWMFIPIFNLSGTKGTHNVQNGAVGLLESFYSPAILFNKAMEANSILLFLLFVFLSVAWCVFFLKILGVYYKRLNTGITTFGRHGDYEVSEIKAKNPIKALVKKEVQRFLNCPPYTMNTLLWLIIALAGSIAFCVIGETKIMALSKIPEFGRIIGQVTPLVLATILGLCNTTSMSLSLEGKNLWILESLPLSSKTIFTSKILFNLILQIPVGFICSLLLAFSIKMDLFTMIMLFVMPMVYSFTNTVVGMYFNIKYPHFQWVSEMEVIRGSLSNILTKMFTLANGMIPIIMVILAEKFVMPIMLGVTGAEALIALLLYWHISKIQLREVR
ncbi:hypothetical protein LJC18_02550 [Lachnospiraceae bacterium OttesenSCG-928-E19]|nr:hypothetical protein [Lachnospiraceae bacterium OttesenSCG-928-E19]